MSGRLLLVRRGIYAAPQDLSPQLAALAAHRALRGSVISHESAALFEAIPLLGPAPPGPILTLHPYGDGSATAAHLHRARLRDIDVVTIAGADCTAPARTVVDLARRSVRGGVVAMDAAVKKESTTFRAIDDVLDFCGNWPGIRRARTARALSDGLAESPLESLSRLDLRRIGLPAPTPQVRIFDLHGRFVARVDYYWEEFGVVGEVDGLSKYTGHDVLTAEKARHEALEDLRLTVTRWGAVDLRRPRALEQRILRAFARGRALDASGVPRLWTVRYADPRH